MALCESCKASGECKLLELKSREEKAFRSQMEAYQKIKEHTNEVPELVETEQHRVLRQHLEFKDAQLVSADVLGCPNKFSF